jgi:hypothetical protein
VIWKKKIVARYADEINTSVPTDPIPDTTRVRLLRVYHDAEWFSYH